MTVGYPVFNVIKHIVRSYATVTHSAHKENGWMNNYDRLLSHHITKFKLMVNKLMCACVMHSTMTPRVFTSY